MESPYQPPASASTPETAINPTLVNWTHFIYGLHALSLAIGVAGAATIVGAFLWSVPSIAAVIINYVKRSDVRGTFLDSHFSWQIRTFWFAALWASIAVVLWFLLAIVLIGFLIGPIMLFATGVWVIYRVIRGWLALRDNKSMPVPA